MQKGQFQSDWLHSLILVEHKKTYQKFPDLASSPSFSDLWPLYFVHAKMSDCARLYETYLQTFNTLQRKHQWRMVSACVLLLYTLLAGIAYRIGLLSKISLLISLFGKDKCSIIQEVSDLLS